MNHSWEEILEFFTIYSSREYENRDKFVKKLKTDFNISEKKALLIWQCFDVSNYMYNYYKFTIK